MNPTTQALSRRNLLAGAGTGIVATVLPSVGDASTLGQFTPAGGDRIGHDTFDALLQRFVQPDAERYNRVDYRALRDAGHQTVKTYVTGLVQSDPTRLSRDEAHAYWINLYNAKTLDVVLDHYPVRSIRDIKLGGGGLFKTGPWSRKLLIINGTELSLDDIEHRIVRPVFSDPMSHYGLNCASYSCPNLATRAYTGENIAGMLAQSGRDYVNHSRGVHVSNGRITASRIYNWYADDFGGTGGLKRHWMALATPDLASRIEAASIGGYDYDWSLNDV